mmetsp:Transcript_3780/g.4633  ORF Transcript_3780/g.4633 Transcript_3780/m.4633 type:complete len:191 (+) Transcript_3780:117-689(+)
MGKMFCKGKESEKHEPDSSAQPVKPALVVDGKKKKKKKSKKALTWDEHAIEEHDLLRGTRMKIEEPNTPFHYESQSHSSDNESESSYRSRDHTGSGNSINWSHLENKLGAVAAARQDCPPSPMSSVDGGLGNSSGPDSDVDMEKKRIIMKKKEFNLHRKAHYNEMEAIKKWREEHPNGDDEDDDDEDDNN